MRRRHIIAALTLALGIISGQVFVATAQEATVASCSPEKDAFCYQPTLAEKTHVVADVTMPKIAVPSWLERQTEEARTVTYVVASKGKTQTDMAEFRATVAETLNSPLGWSRLNVRFERVEKDGQFTVWLSEASQVPSFSPSGCDAIVSCRVGDNVIINETRWINGADPWNAAGGTLADYRRMVINHETGHWLGHGHEYCGGNGKDAPVMQQQTLDMQGCRPNPWPLVQELYAPTLGIYS